MDFSVYESRLRPGHRRERHPERQQTAVARSSLPGAAQLLDSLTHAARHEKVVGDARDLLRLTPRALQLRELALQGTALGLLVQGHLEREPLNLREAEQPVLGHIAHERVA